MKNFKFEREGNRGLLTFFGELTLERANELKEALILSLENSDSVMVNFEKVTKLDTFCLQQICLAHRISVRLNKRLFLIGVRTDAFRQAVIEAGYAVHMGCVMN